MYILIFHVHESFMYILQVYKMYMNLSCTFYKYTSDSA